ncbi:hypothetical protein T4B_4653 [Trichinella pseudospiralis]|uniref:Uncharacterized protein n=1 Tax=Trichinella pseudospiralis TaxID=6337 RepID=A0A0V1IK92_TRIPS|nr:hypothetical protein T4B_4653 [Trichinella pseudospiralis]
MLRYCIYFLLYKTTNITLRVTTVDASAVVVNDIYQMQAYFKNYISPEHLCDMNIYICGELF